METIAIAGLGVSGLACALELTRQNIPFVAFEKDHRPGGLAKTETLEGFRLDYGPHIILGLPADLRGWLDTLPDLDLEVCSGRSCIALGKSLERVVPVPFQKNLNYLPLPLRLRLAFELMGQKQNGMPPLNYREFATARCGKRIYETFLGKYESKRLRFNLEEIPPDWTDRLEPPSLSSLLAPRWSHFRQRTNHAERSFLYPRSGGIEALPCAMAKLLPLASLRYSNAVEEIDARASQLVPQSGRPISYRYLVITLPLPEIVRMLKDPPVPVREAAEELHYTSIYVISAGVSGPTPPWSLIRFPNSDVGFYRLSFPSQYTRNSAPPGHSLIVGEMSHHPSRHAVSPRTAVGEFRSGLKRLGVLRSSQESVVESIRDIRYGHVVYSHRTRAAISTILEHLEKHSIIVCGKYGLWRDMLMTHSILSGIEAARMIGRRVQGPSTN